MAKSPDSEKSFKSHIYIETISFSSTERLTIAPESCVAIVKYTVIEWNLSELAHKCLRYCLTNRAVSESQTPWY